jgi:DUF1009 family protein
LTQPLGIVAGDGCFPLEIARAVRSRGRPVVAIGFRGLTDPALEPAVDALHWLRLGELGALVGPLHRAGARDAVLAGKVSKTHLYASGEEIRPDARAAALLAEVADRADGSILGALASALEREGIVLRSQSELVPELVAPAGRLGSVRPSREMLADVRYGWHVARALAGLDVGQSVVVKERAVMAVEAIEGTDAAIRRGGELGGPGVCLVKAARPAQDPRFDLPAVGPETIEVLAGVRGARLAVEAGMTLLLDREALVERADAHGIALLGVDAAGLPDPEAAQGPGWEEGSS